MSGAIHVRTRLTEDFTILANRLAQRPGSAVTVGVGLFINSMPDGTPITIEALQQHFDEGEAVISRALRELEAEGWLERRLIRLANGRLATRTYVYTLPELLGRRSDPALEPPEPEPTPAPPAVSTPAPAAADAPTEPAESCGQADQRGGAEPTDPSAPGGPASPASPQAAEVLTGLSSVDPRLLLTRKEIGRLAPGVDAWLTSGVHPERITSALTTDLPSELRTRPAHLLAWRLHELQPAPTPPPAPDLPPLQNCMSCDQGFRGTSPGRCPYCRHSPAELPALDAHPEPTSPAALRVAQRLTDRLGSVGQTAARLQS